MAVLFAVIIGGLLGFQIGEDYQEPVYKTNLATYEIYFERCLDHPSATISDCHEVAQFKSLTCWGCE